MASAANPGTAPAFLNPNVAGPISAPSGNAPIPNFAAASYAAPAVQSVQIYSTTPGAITTPGQAIAVADPGAPPPPPPVIDPTAPVIDYTLPPQPPSAPDPVPAPEVSQDRDVPLI
jgi:hypothetical protein